MTVVIRTGPQEYECSAGVLNSLVDRLEKRGVKKAVIVHGNESWRKARSHFSELLNSDFFIELTVFNGECTYEEVERIHDFAKTHESDTIIGVGGGKVMDTVKYAAAKSGLNSVLIPTLASNCAPWTPISVMYSEEGICLGFDVHTAQVDLLLVDPELIMTSPINYLIAGLADTLAKWYESERILSLPEYAQHPFLSLAKAAAYQCKTVIIDKGHEAIDSMTDMNLTQAFTTIVDTIIAVSGLVGGLGDKYARTTIGHAVHDKLTVYPQTHAFLHGEKVAYGIMVQLSFEDKWDEIKSLLPLYDTLNLPKSLRDLHLGKLTDNEVKSFSDNITGDGALVASGYPISAEKLYESIQSLEEFFNLARLTKSIRGYN